MAIRRRECNIAWSYLIIWLSIVVVHERPNPFFMRWGGENGNNPPPVIVLAESAVIGLTMGRNPFVNASANSVAGKEKRLAACFPSI